MDWQNRIISSLVEEHRYSPKERRESFSRKRDYRYSSGTGDPTLGQQSKPSRGRGVAEIEASKRKGSPHRKRMAGHIKRLRKHPEYTS